MLPTTLHKNLKNPLTKTVQFMAGIRLDVYGYVCLFKVILDISAMVNHHATHHLRNIFYFSNHLNKQSKPLFFLLKKTLVKYIDFLDTKVFENC